ncbi:MAG: hypothetical protein GY904_07400 [Planctomycetaceae bacterium]|nr:hypothetical protein [Planctomycetaceae bacterium]
MLMIRSLIFAFFCTTLLAQQPPYDQPPKAEPPYYRVRYEASPRKGECIFPVSYTLWVPPAVKNLRGVIVHQHGCGEGSCRSGQTGAFDLHWQALAAEHQCALLAPSYEQPQDADCQMWCDPRNGSGLVFERALSELGNACGHPELASVPWALWGHSGGGHWAGGMLFLHPERVAAVWLRSGVPLMEPVDGRAIKPHEISSGSLRVPIMCNFGTKEGFTVKDKRFSGVWPANEKFFKAMRSRNALIGIAVDPLSSHECGNQRYLAIPWFDACLKLRLPQRPDQPLRGIDTTSGKTVPWKQASSEPPFDSIWLPNDSIASAWTGYTEDTEVVDRTAPPAPTNVTLAGDQLTWQAKADLQSGISHFLVQRDGVTIATIPEKPSRSFGRPLFQGLQYSDTPSFPLVEMKCTVPPIAAGAANPYQVLTVNTAGQVSRQK